MLIYRQDAKAQIVLNIVLEHVSYIADRYGENSELTVSTYRNGRENGYVCSFYHLEQSKRVAFSENCNSDHIVVYPRIDEITGMLTDKGYEDRVIFAHDDYSTAAMYVLKLLGFQDLKSQEHI